MISLSLTFVGCGKGSKGKPSKLKRTIRMVEAGMAKVLANQNFECASIDGKECPEGIARLFIIKPEDVESSGVCSGFMVDSETLVTNHHCLSTEKQCETTYIAVVFGDQYLQTRCDHIISTFEDADEGEEKTIDYTVLKIKHTYEGGVFKLSPTNNITDGEKVTAWVVDHTGLDEAESNFNNFRISEFQCETFDHPLMASVALDHCPLISGNSGSPAVNSNGEIVGVIWGGQTGDFDSQTDLETRRNDPSGVGALTKLEAFRNYIEF